MFIELLSVCVIVSFGQSLASNSKEPIKCVSLNNRTFQARPTLVDLNSSETLFYSFTIRVNECGGNCKTIEMNEARS